MTDHLNTTGGASSDESDFPVEPDVWDADPRPRDNTHPFRHFLVSPIGIWLLVCLLTIAGAAFRLHHLGHKSFWVDESISHVLAREGEDPAEHPPLYFRVLGLWLNLLDREGEAWTRFPSALFGTLTIPLIFLLGSEAVNRRTGLAAAFILAVSPYHIQISQEARMYSLLGLLTVTTLLFLFLALQRRRLRSAAAWCAFGLACAGTLYTHHLGVLLIPVCLIPLLLRPGPRWRPLLCLTGALALSLLIYLPQLPRTVSQVNFRERMMEKAASDRPDTDEVSPERSLRQRAVDGGRKSAGVLYYLGAGYRYTDLSGEGLTRALARWPDRFLLPLYAAVPMLLALTGCLALIRRGQNPTGMAMLGLLLLAVLAAAIEGSPANHLVVAFPAYAILMGAGLASCPGRLFRGGLILLLFVLSLLALDGYYKSPTYMFHHEDWRAACRHLNTVSRPDDIVFVHGGRNGYFTVLHYYQGTAAVECAVPHDKLFHPYSKEELPNFDLIGTISALLGKHEHVWFLYPDWGSATRREELVHLNRLYLVRARNFGKDLFLFQYSLRGEGTIPLGGDAPVRSGKR